MNRITAFFTAIVFCLTGSIYAESVGGPGGRWPKSWPQELESFRKQASTWIGGQIAATRYQIPFSKRETFESAWPHIVKVKSKGAAITLYKAPHYYGKTGGVVIFPPLETYSEGPYSVTRIGLIVDGEIVDLNRIPIPSKTPIIDRRFESKRQKTVLNTKTSTEKEPASDNKPADRSSN